METDLQRILIIARLSTTILLLFLDFAYSEGSTIPTYAPEFHINKKGINCNTSNLNYTNDSFTTIVRKILIFLFVMQLFCEKAGTKRNFNF